MSKAETKLDFSLDNNYIIQRIDDFEGIMGITWQRMSMCGAIVMNRGVKFRRIQNQVRTLSVFYNRIV